MAILCGIPMTRGRAFWLVPRELRHESLLFFPPETLLNPRFTTTSETAWGVPREEWAREEIDSVRQGPRMTCAPVSSRFLGQSSSSNSPVLRRSPSIPRRNPSRLREFGVFSLPTLEIGDGNAGADSLRRGLARDLGLPDRACYRFSDLGSPEQLQTGSTSGNGWAGSKRGFIHLEKKRA